MLLLAGCGCWQDSGRCPLNQQIDADWGENSGYHDVGPPAGSRDLTPKLYRRSRHLQVQQVQQASSAVVTEELSSKVSGTAPRAVGLPANDQGICVILSKLVLAASISSLHAVMSKSSACRQRSMSWPGTAAVVSVDVSNIRGKELTLQADVQ